MSFCASRRSIFARLSVAGLLLGAIVLGALLLDPLQKLLHRDPFAHLRATNNQLGGDVGIEVGDVTLLHYEGSRLAGKARVRQMLIRKDRQWIDLTGIDGGEYFGQGKKHFKFQAQHATWNAFPKTLEVRDGVRVRNEDMDLHAQVFFYDQREKLLKVPGEVEGRFFDGQVVAASLRYDLNTDAYEIGPANWQGAAKAPQEEKARKWSIKTQGISKRVGDVESWQNAEATDGEIIVVADRIDRDVKTDVITATGKVLYFSEDANVSCAKAVVFRKEKRAVLTGAVNMYVKPEDQKKLERTEVAPVIPIVPDSVSKDRPPAPASDQEKKLDEEIRSTQSRRKYPITVLAQKVEYWYKKGERHAVISGSPQARQELAAGRWRMGWAPVAYYDAEKETLKLVSSNGKKDTRVKTSLGDDLVASWFQFSTKEGDDSWEGEGVEGDVYPDDEDLPQGKKNEGGGTGGGGGGQKPPPSLRGRLPGIKH